MTAAGIKRRAQRLRKLGEAKRAAFADGFVGTHMRVLVEATAARAPDRVHGYSRNYQRVELNAAPGLANREVTATILAAQGAILLGQLAEDAGHE